MLQRVARDIRNTYTLGYVPSSAARTNAAKPALRRVSVEVRQPGGQRLSVRTRSAYLAGPEGGQGDER